MRGRASRAVSRLVADTERPGQVVGVLPYAVYMVSKGSRPDVLAVLTRDAICVPNGVVISASSAEKPFASIRIGMRASFGGGLVQVGTLTVRIAEWWSPARPRLENPQDAHIRTAEYTHLLSAAAAPLPTWLAEPVASFETSLVRGPEYATNTALALLGLGPGLTPSGDDIVAATLVGLWALSGPNPRLPDPRLSALANEIGRVVVTHAQQRTPVLSWALLAHAAAGRCISQLAEVINALGTRRPLGDPLAALLAVGHHSGSDLGRGVALALGAAKHQAS